MTVTSTTITNAFTGNGSTTSFATTFPFQGTGATAELEVIQRTIATGAETTLSYTTHYTVTGGNGSTGTVVAASAPADTVQWHVRRKTTQTQTTDYIANDPFPADTHELALDRLAMVQQEQQADIDKTSKLPDTYTGGASPILPEPSASKLLAWNSSANALENTTGKVVSASVSVSTLSAGASATGSASYTDSTGALAFTLGIPRGDTGATGPAGGYTDPLTTRGDIVARGASSTGRLAIGSANTVLTTAGTDPAWSTIATAMIADDAISSAKIADDAVVQAAIADDAVNEARLQVSNSPTNGYFLSAQSGATGGMTWAAAGGGSLTFLNSTDLSSAATFNFTAVDASAYDSYRMILQSVTPATDAVDVQFKTSSNGGSSYDSSGSDYEWRCHLLGPGAGADGSAGDSSIDLIGDLGSADGQIGSAAGEDGLSGWIDVIAPHLTNHTTVQWYLSYETPNGELNMVIGAAKRLSAADVDAWRLLFSSGNIESGTITTYGLKNA